MGNKINYFKIATIILGILLITQIIYLANRDHGEIETIFIGDLEFPQYLGAEVAKRFVNESFQICNIEQNGCVEFIFTGDNP